MKYKAINKFFVGVAVVIILVITTLMIKNNIIETVAVDNIAVVNEDVAVEYNGESIKLSDYFMLNILQTSDYNVSIVSREEADNGLNNNVYSMEIIFPSTFTESTMSINNKIPTKVPVEYIYNDHLSSENLLKLQNDVDLFSFYLNSSLNYIYTYGIIDGINEFKNYYDNIIEASDENINSFDNIMQYDLLADKTYELTPFDNGGIQLEGFDTSEFTDLDLSEQNGQVQSLSSEYSSDLESIETTHNDTEQQKYNNIDKEYNAMNENSEIQSETIDLLLSYLTEKSGEQIQDYINISNIRNSADVAIIYYLYTLNSQSLDSLNGLNSLNGYIQNTQDTSEAIINYPLSYINSASAISGNYQTMNNAVVPTSPAIIAIDQSNQLINKVQICLNESNSQTCISDNNIPSEITQVNSNINQTITSLQSIQTSFNNISQEVVTPISAGNEEYMNVSVIQNEIDNIDDLINTTIDVDTYTSAKYELESNYTSTVSQYNVDKTEINNLLDTLLTSVSNEMDLVNNLINESIANQDVDINLENTIYDSNGNNNFVYNNGKYYYQNEEIISNAQCSNIQTQDPNYTCNTISQILTANGVSEVNIGTLFNNLFENLEIKNNIIYEQEQAKEKINTEIFNLFSRNPEETTLSISSDRTKIYADNISAYINGFTYCYKVDDNGLYTDVKEVSNNSRCVSFEGPEKVDGIYESLQEQNESISNINELNVETQLGVLNTIHYLQEINAISEGTNEEFNEYLATNEDVILDYAKYVEKFYSFNFSIAKNAFVLSYDSVAKYINSIESDDSLTIMSEEYISTLSQNNQEVQSYLDNFSNLIPNSSIADENNSILINFINMPIRTIQTKSEKLTHFFSSNNRYILIILIIIGILVIYGLTRHTKDE